MVTVATVAVLATPTEVGLQLGLLSTVLPRLADQSAWPFRFVACSIPSHDPQKTDPLATMGWVEITLPSATLQWRVSWPAEVALMRVSFPLKPLRPLSPR